MNKQSKLRQVDKKEDKKIKAPKQDFWSFTHFTSDNYKYRERWERDNSILKEELMLIVYNIDPMLQIETGARAVHFGSQNAWYQYKKFDIWEAQDVTKAWLIELHPTAENPERPYSHAHMRFEVIKPDA